MRMIFRTAALPLLSTLLMSGIARAEPSLTIYNQNFGVVRDTVALNLQAGVNRVAAGDVTTMLEPDSVILRDPTGQRALQILEQNYRADAVSQELLLSRFEGQTIDFLVTRGDVTEIVKGKIIRSGVTPTMAGYGRGNYQYQNYSGYNAAGQPLVEVDGKLRFGLPGTPLFPNLPGDSILKPSLNWVLSTERAGPLQAELSYVSGGFNWEADYNVVAPDSGDVLDLTGWVTLSNNSGKTFDNAQIKLMAGDVSKLQTDENGGGGLRAKSFFAIGGYTGAPPVTEKTFDEYHLYTLQRPTTLRDRETKQVEFIRANGVKAQRIYVYDGFKMDSRYNGYSSYDLRSQESYGTQSNPKVWVMREFVNTAANGLGMPLPAGRVRFYRRDGKNQNAALEFIGESRIDHTPKDETIRVYTGNAFDIAGERKRTDFKSDSSQHFVDETFEIKLRNHKTEAAEVRVVEHLYRWTNWAITQSSNTYLKTDAQTMEFRVQLKPDEEKTVAYTVHYTW